MSPALPVILRGGNTLRDPRRLPGMAAWFDGLDPASLIYDGSNRTALLGDKSGNSAENGLVTLGSGSNFATSPDSAAVSLTGEMEIVFCAALQSWSELATKSIFSKRAGSSQESWQILTSGSSAGVIRFLIWDGGGSLQQYASSVGVGFAAREKGWVKITIEGAAGVSSVKFYTSSDGVSFTQLGTTQAGVYTTSITRDTTAPLAMMAWDAGSDGCAGVMHRAILRNGINGTLAFDANFAAQSKLATSFTESSSNAATVTINTSGATGARIAGARDMYQGTVGSQPTYSLANRTLTFDGIDDFLKTAAFTLGQPVTLYFVGSQIAWSANLALCDGASADTLRLVQSNLTPEIRMRSGGTEPALSEINLPLGTRGLIRAVFNGSSASLGKNGDSAITDAVGGSTPGGFTLAARHDGGGPSNITVNEIAIYNTAHTAAQQAQFWRYAKRKWGIAA